MSQKNKIIYFQDFVLDSQMLKLRLCRVVLSVSPSVKTHSGCISVISLVLSNFRHSLGVISVPLQIQFEL